MGAERGGRGEGTKRQTAIVVLNSPGATDEILSEDAYRARSIKCADLSRCRQLVEAESRLWLTAVVGC